MNSHEPLITVERSSSSRLIRLRFGGSIGTIAITGESWPLHIGLERVTPRLISNIVNRAHRADGYGDPLPVGARMKLEKLVGAKLHGMVDAKGYLKEPVEFIQDARNALLDICARILA